YLKETLTNIDFETETIQIDGQEPVRGYIQKKCDEEDAKVRLVETVTIPSRSVMSVRARSVNENTEQTRMIYSDEEIFQKRLVTAQTGIVKGKEYEIRLANPHEQSVRLYAGSTIARSSEVDVIKAIGTEE